MTPEVIATLIASFGAIIATLFGIYRASSGNGNSKATTPEGKPLTVPDMVSHYLDILREIERNLGHAVDTLRSIRQALEGTGRNQETMVKELEKMARSMDRIENEQGVSARVIEDMKHHEDVQVKILAQIRDEIKGMRNLELPPHRSL